MTLSNKMKIRLLAAAAATLVCCASCVENSTRVGQNLIPVGQMYSFHTVDIPLDDVYVRMADSLSGFSNSRITVGAVRDADYGLSTRKCALTLIPMVDGEIDFGKNPKFKSFHFAASKDTTSWPDPSQERILQSIKVYELSKAIDNIKDYDCNKPLERSAATITKGTPVYNGTDSLSFNFNDDFGRKYMTMTTEDLKDIDTYLAKFPGIMIESDAPSAEGGRINMFKVQLSFDSNYGYVEGNYAKLSFSGEYNGERRDSSFLFYYGASDFYDLDSLFTHSSTGKFPQYALNLSSQQTGGKVGYAEESIDIEGGGGLKPVISANWLRDVAEREITRAAQEQGLADVGQALKAAVINKASLVFPFEMPSDYKLFNYWPAVLSPTCRIKGEEVTSFMGLTDSSSSSENQGDINRSRLEYSPDITFHLQEILKIDKDDTGNTKTKRLANGDYDIWLLIMANEIVTTTTQGSSDLSEMYQYLAYQSYYNDMYGYGYGSGGYSNYYSNYYNYAMLAAYAGSSSTSQSVSTQLDKDRYYKATLNGPQYPDESRRPHLRLTFALPNE